MRAVHLWDTPAYMESGSDGVNFANDVQLGKGGLLAGGLLQRPHDVMQAAEWTPWSRSRTARLPFCTTPERRT